MAIGLREMATANSVLGRMLLTCSIILAVARAIQSNETAKCTISGLRDPPSLVEGQRNVFMKKTKNESILLSLQCSCTHLIPYWTVYEVDSQESFRRTLNIQECSTNETGAIYNCTKDRSTFFLNPKPDVLLVNFETFSINQTTILMCSDSSIVQETVIISVSPDTTDDNENAAMQRGCVQPAERVSETVQASVAPTSTVVAVTSSQVSLANHETTLTVSSSSPLTTILMSSSSQATTSETTSKLATSSSPEPGVIIDERSSTSNHDIVTSSVVESILPTVHNTITEGIGSPEEFVDAFGIPILVVFPVAVVSLLLNVVLIFWIVCRRKKNSSRYDMQQEEATPTHSVSSSLERSNKARSIDRLLPMSLSTGTLQYNNNNNNNNNNNSNNNSTRGIGAGPAAMRTSQSAIVISNHSVDLSD